ncbi:MAG: TlpA family protein disulfide reductase [Flavobacteriia bacterium]|nr:TlpA family protein disulfide reductase [Flavobacteriia bacterium]
MFQKILVALLALCGFSANSQVTITGHFSGQRRQAVSIKYCANYYQALDWENTYRETEVDEDGQFSFKLKINHPFEIGSMYADTDMLLYGMYLFPGDSIHFEIDVDGIAASGTGGVHFEIKAQLSELYSLHRNTDYSSLSHQEYIETIQAELESEFSLVETFYETGQISAKQLEYYRANFETDYMISYVQYSWRKQDITTDFYSPKSLEMFTAGIPLEREDLLNNTRYIHFLDQFNYAYLAAARNEAEDSVDNYILWRKKFDLRDSIIDLYLTGKFAEAARYSLLLDELRILGYAKGREHYESVLETVNAEKRRVLSKIDDPKLDSMIERAYSAILIQEKDIPQFTALSQSGDTLDFSEFKGKVVYLDIWATSCAPCRSEIGPSQRLAASLDEDSVIMISISIDNDSSQAFEFAESRDMPGRHYWAPQGWNSELVRAMSISGIPQYYIINPEGKIVNANAPRPSSGVEDALRDAWR